MALRDELLGMDMKAFWEENALCREPFTKEKPRVPVSLSLGGDWVCEHVGMSHADYYQSYEKQQEARLNASEDTDRGIGFRIGPGLDFGVILDASLYGGKVVYHQNAAPDLEPVCREPGDVYRLARELENADLLCRGLVPKYLEWWERRRRDFAIEVDTKVHSGGTKGPCTIAGQICGVTNFLTWLHTHPGEVRFLMDLIADVTIEYVRQMAARQGFSVRGYGFANDLAGLMSPEHYREFSFPVERRIYEAFAPDKGDNRFYHADSDMSHQLDALRDLGVTGVNLGPKVDSERIRAKLPEAVIVGQIPPTQVLRNGTPEDVIAAARHDIEAVGGDGGLVLATAGSVNPGTSFLNMRALCYAADKYGRYDSGLVTGNQ